MKGRVILFGYTSEEGDQTLGRHKYNADTSRHYYDGEVNISPSLEGVFPTITQLGHVAAQHRGQYDEAHQT